MKNRILKTIFAFGSVLMSICSFALVHPVTTTPQTFSLNGNADLHLSVENQQINHKTLIKKFYCVIASSLDSKIKIASIRIHHRNFREDANSSVDGFYTFIPQEGFYFSGEHQGQKNSLNYVSFYNLNNLQLKVTCQLGER